MKGNSRLVLLLDKPSHAILLANAHHAGVHGGTMQLVNTRRRKNLRVAVFEMDIEGLLRNRASVEDLIAKLVDMIMRAIRA